MEPQAKARPGTGWKACATVIFPAEAWQQEGTPAVLLNVPACLFRTLSLIRAACKDKSAMAKT